MKNLLLKLNREGVTLEENEGKLKVHFMKEDIDHNLLKEIKDNKSNLLALLKENKFEHIPQVAVGDDYSLSHAQMRLWMLSQSKDTSIAYNISSHVYLNDIDITCFKKSIADVIERHESFRTIFITNTDGEVRQRIISSEALDFKIDYKDFRGSKDILNRTSSYINEDAKVPFDLENGPLLRASLLQTSDNQYVFYYCMHHIISDGWSMNVLEKDVMAIYANYKSGRSTTLPPLNIQYKDYAAWQLGQSDSEEQNRHQEYWLKTLSGDLPLIDLPSFKSRPGIKTHNGYKLSSHISKATTKALKDFCREGGGSLFMGLLAAWNVLCYRYTSQKDIIVGTPVSGRDHSDLKDQIGFYINTLALRNEINPEESFNNFFETVRRNTITSFKYQEYPFDQLVEELDVKRDVSRNAIFDVMLVLQNVREGAVAEDFIDFEKQDQVVDHGESISKFDLELIFQEANNHLVVSVKYNRDVYDRTMIEKLLLHFNTMLGKLLSNPKIPVNEISFLSESEKKELLFSFNDTQKEYPTDKTVVDIFQEQVNKSPDKNAIVFNGEEISYRELDERSNQLARYLSANFNIVEDDIVGIKLQRSENLVIAIFAILKLGAAYVPIDPDFPENRIEYIIEEINSKVIIDNTLIESFSKEDDFPTASLDIKVTPNQLAYVIYTSGSTGTPKGVMIEHGGLVNLCFWNRDEYDISESSRNTMFVGVAFDASVLEIYPALLFGGTLYPIADEDVRLDVNKLASFLNDNGITYSFIPPKICQSFVEQDIPINAAIVTGGEALRYSKKPNIRIYNNYGPTENTVVASNFDCEDVLIDNIPIGKPMDNVSMYILSEKLMLQPVGVVGEICLGGVGLSRGYLNRPELTNEKFIDHPFNEGERLYKTGDLGRFLPDGNIEFKGRVDDQVKIRGYRIELGEIESLLLSFDFITQAVLDIKEVEGEKAIVAYVIPVGILDKRMLKDKLGESLPKYMIPSYYVELSSIPFTPSGKVNKKGLPPISDQDLIKEEYIAPRNEMEKELARIWQEVLSVDQVGLKSNFLDLGGHSLKAIKLINEIHRKFDVRLELKQIFTTPDLEQQSLLIKSSIKNTFNEISRIEESDAYIISNAQRRLWVLSQIESNSVSYNMPKTIHLGNDFKLDILKKSIEAVVDRHEVFRTVFFTDENEEILQRVLSREELGFKIDFQDFRGVANEKEVVRAFVDADANRPFDLKNGPLFRVSILQTSDDGILFFYNTHHIISDGWSVNILERDVMAFYDAYLTDTEVDLPTLNIQYKDYAVWQANQLETEEYKEHQEYWLNTFSKNISLLDLPSSKSRPIIKTHKGHTLGTYISNATSKALRKFCKAEGGSLFMGLLATWNVLCHRYTAQEDIIIGTPVAGRDHADLKDQIGFYINTLVLRNEINPEESFKTLFNKVKENTIESFKHQQYPFDKLVEELDLKRDLSRNPIFDIMLVFQNTKENNVNQKNTNLDRDKIFDKGNSNAKVDIELVFSEEGEDISLALKYNTEVYDRSMIGRLLIHFKQLLNSLMAARELPISKVNYLSEKEENTLLHVFNDTKVDYPAGKTIVDLFNEKAEESSQSVAIVFEDREVTYQELDEKSNQLAYYLTANFNVNQGDFVGIQLERSEWMIISIFATLKLGASYVPIDPNYPETRVEFIESDSNCKVTIDEKTLADFTNSKPFPFGKVVLSKVKPEDLAYVIYTSGSTGKPKGVPNAHAGIYNRLLWKCDNFNVSSDDVFLQKTPYTFDVSVWELLTPFIAGSRLVIAKPEGHKSPQYLQRIIDQKQVTIIHFVPSMLRVFVDDLEEDTCRSLKHVICSGEALPASLVQDFKQKLPWVRIHNLYGPTEAAIDVTAVDLTEADTEKHGVSIGKPVANTRIHIVDKHLALQPFGVSGELLIEGIQVAKGYLNRDELSKEKFIQSPFDTSQMAYRTGDLARWLPNGEIAYIGRMDNQIKIRGNRVELGEIETALLLSDSISQGAVVVKKVDENDAIVAYVVATEMLDKKAIRNELSSQLPDYMVPSYFIELTTIPLNSNGKVDRKALPDVEGKDIIKEIYQAPETAEEKALVSVFEEVLKNDSTSVTDSFYNLGGDSIKALKVVSGLKRLGFVLKVEDLLRNPKVEDLARFMTKVNTLAKYPDYVEKEWNIGDEVGLSKNQEVYFSKHAVGSFSFYNYEHDPGSFEKDFRQVLAKFPGLCVALKQEGTLVKQELVSAEDVKLKIETRKISFVTKNKINRLVQSYTAQTFDQLDGELIRVLAIQNRCVKKKKKALVFIFIHHILTDNFSNEILKQEFEKIFENKQIESRGKPHFDFVNWQNKFLISKEGLRQRDYWMKALENVSKSNKITTRENGVSDYVIQKMILAGEEFNLLQSISTTTNIPLSVLFLEMHQRILKDDRLESTSLQGVVVTGREQEIEGLDIGNLLGVVNNLSLIPYVERKGNSEIEYLRLIYAKYLESRAYQQIPYLVIRQDFEREYKSNLDTKIGGIFNFQIRQNSILEFTDKSMITEYKQLSKGGSIDLTCVVHGNAVEVNLAFPKSEYDLRKSDLSLHSKIIEILKIE